MLFELVSAIEKNKSYSTAQHIKEVLSLGIP